MLILARNISLASVDLMQQTFGNAAQAEMRELLNSRVWTVDFCTNLCSVYSKLKTNGRSSDELLGFYTSLGFQRLADNNIYDHFTIVKETGWKTAVGL